MTSADPDNRRGPADLLAHLVSVATSPFIVSGITGVLLAILLHATLAEALLWAAICVVFAAVIPFAVVYLLWRAGAVTDLHVAQRGQRVVPFAATLFSAAAGLVVLYLAQAPPQLLAVAAAFLGNGIPLTLISLGWKVSAHTAVFTGCVLALALVGPPAALGGLGLVPVILWARWYRQRHTIGQGLVPVLMTAAITPLVYGWVMGWLAKG
ncbi:MAG TPA: hypothetical protein VGM19_02330 [Armatimonadota bacterium]|jgi:hypothetical protein